MSSPSSAAGLPQDPGVQPTNANDTKPQDTKYHNDFKHITTKKPENQVFKIERRAKLTLTGKELDHPMTASTGPPSCVENSASAPAGYSDKRRRMEIKPKAKPAVDPFIKRKPKRPTKADLLPEHLAKLSLKSTSGLSGSNLSAYGPRASEFLAPSLAIPDLSSHVNSESGVSVSEPAASVTSTPEPDTNPSTTDTNTESSATVISVAESPERVVGNVFATPFPTTSNEDLLQNIKKVMDGVGGPKYPKVYSREKFHQRMQSIKAVFVKFRDDGEHACMGCAELDCRLGYCLEDMSNAEHRIITLEGKQSELRAGLAGVTEDLAMTKTELINSKEELRIEKKEHDAAKSEIQMLKARIQALQGQ